MSDLTQSLTPVHQQLHQALYEHATEAKRLFSESPLAREVDGPEGFARGFDSGRDRARANINAYVVSAEKGARIAAEGVAFLNDRRDTVGLWEVVKDACEQLDVDTIIDMRDKETDTPVSADERREYAEGFETARTHAVALRDAIDGSITLRRIRECQETIRRLLCTMGEE